MCFSCLFTSSTLKDLLFELKTETVNNCRILVSNDMDTVLKCGHVLDATKVRGLAKVDIDGHGVGVGEKNARIL